ncbi:lysophospholipid acyltransferase family protein [Niabella yanshanensis]|uniref:Lysophospholipid acyltransferase family protein n=1 Tax=Niabella yanshanensis TaxID=577386 RepID=A0ABZ0W874_9BACT|nr:lysophospholipid acyltransferase family protein [Niabella yanshanensis]WQD39487.1 lysophospholipid acyltransferase family protein [Niabella yanshanensis]
MGKFTDRLKSTSLVKKLVHLVVGICTYPGIAIINKLRIHGSDKVKALPKTNVLFVCNHQTYFLDVITLFHIFSAIKWGKRDRLGIPFYVLNPFTRVNYVAAEQTMKSSWMSRLFLLAGGLTVRRTWNENSKEQRAGLDPSDTRKIERSLKNNWIITFPQGTTTPYAPARKGTALIIKHHKPIVIPVVINGFSKAFTKTGVTLRKKGTLLTVTFKEPLQIDYEASAQEITEQLMDAIEQSKKFMPEVLTADRH